MRIGLIVNALSSQPWGSLVLAVLTLLAGGLFASGWLPPAKKYLPGHDWVMAAVCVLLALLFTYCAVVGFRKRSNESPLGVGGDPPCELD